MCVYTHTCEYIQVYTYVCKEFGNRHMHISYARVYTHTRARTHTRAHTYTHTRAFTPTWTMSPTSYTHVFCVNTQPHDVYVHTHACT